MIKLRLPVAKRILDFGCGSGWVLANAETFGSPLLVGIDRSRVAIETGRSGRRELCWVIGDGLCLPFADGTFDVVIGHVSLPYMDTNDALAEIFRVLSPGGATFLTCHSFRYWASRVRRSGQAFRLRDVVFMTYVAANGVLNHYSFRQRPWWKTGRFETVNTRRGVCGSAKRAGFEHISAEYGSRRWFFAVTASKPIAGGVPLQRPEWTIDG